MAHFLLIYSCLNHKKALERKTANIVHKKDKSLPILIGKWESIMSDLSTTPKKQSADYFNLTNNGMSASEILGNNAANAAQSTANEFQNFLKEAVETVNSGVNQAKNTMSGVRGLSQEVSNRTGNADPTLASLYSENDLFKELYGETPTSKIPQKIVALADQEKNKPTDKAETTDKTEKVADSENADATASDTEAVPSTTDTADTANAEETPNNSEESTEEGTDKVATTTTDDAEEDDESGDIMDLLSNVATLGTIAGLIV